MIAAGIFGLLIPAMEEAEIIYGDFSIIPVVIGFILGGIFLNLLDKNKSHGIDRGIFSYNKKKMKGAYYGK